MLRGMDTSTHRGFVSLLVPHPLLRRGTLASRLTRTPSVTRRRRRNRSAFTTRANRYRKPPGAGYPGVRTLSVELTRRGWRLQLLAILTKVCCCDMAGRTTTNSAMLGNGQLGGSTTGGVGQGRGEEDVFACAGVDPARQNPKGQILQEGTTTMANCRQ